jgi:uncharacterized membrane protein YdjX (TVP38/TMEM64 family)
MQVLVTSRKFWGALIALVVIVIAAFMPGFDLDQEQVVSLAVIVVSYLVGTAIDPGPGGWKGVILSRKFWAAVIGLVVIFLDAFHVIIPFQLSTEQLVSFVLVISGYIAGVAIEQPKKLNQPALLPVATPAFTTGPEETEWNQG